MQEESISGQHTNSVIKTVKFHALMRWIPTHQQWFMYNAINNKFIMHFFDGENISHIFPGMQRGKDNLFELEIKKPTQL